MLLPPLGEGRDGGWLCSLPQRGRVGVGAGCGQKMNTIQDGLQNCFKINKRCIGRKPKQIKTLIAKKGTALRVICACSLMLRTIKLNNELGVQARKVCDVAPQGMLAAEFKTQLLRAQTRP